MKRRSKIIISAIIFLGILLITSYFYLFFIKEYYIEGIVLDEETQQPVSGVDVMLRGSIEAPGLLYGLSFGSLSWNYSYDVVTDENGYFFQKLDNRNFLAHPDAIKVEISFIKANTSYTYEHVREHSFVNRNITIKLDKKGNTPEYAAGLDTITECTDNGFYWDRYDNKCLLEYIQIVVKKNCLVDEDCQKICPYGCFSNDQENDPHLAGYGPDYPECTKREHVCVCVEEKCRSIEYPQGYFD